MGAEKGDEGEPPPIGVCLIHQYYPGFIDVIPDSQFLIDAPDLRGSVQILSHVRPLIITDFGNSLVKRPRKKRTFISFARPIGKIADDALSIEGHGPEGRQGPVCAVEKAAKGRVFYQGLYTELQSCTEVASLSENPGLLAHPKLVDRLVGTYRYLKPDPRLAMPEELPSDTTPLRVGYYRYTGEQRAMPFAERIQFARADRLQLSMMSYRTAGRALQDHQLEGLENRSVQLGAWLGAGFALTDNLAEIERLADLAFNAQRLRAAVVEAVSILELGILAARSRAIAAGTAPWAKTGLETDDMTLKYILETVLPLLLKAYEGPVGPIVDNAKSARCIRNKVVHHGHQPSMDETNSVLSAARKILSILELADTFKGNYKSNAGAAG